MIRGTNQDLFFDFLFRPSFFEETASPIFQARKKPPTGLQRPDTRQVFGRYP